MNPELSRAFVSHHIRDIRREAALAAGPAEPTGLSGPATPQLRSRIGFALVEAGLRLLADRSPPC